MGLVDSILDPNVVRLVLMEMFQWIVVEDCFLVHHDLMEIHSNNLQVPPGNSYCCRICRHKCCNLAMPHCNVEHRNTGHTGHRNHEECLRLAVVAVLLRNLPRDRG